MSLCLNYTNVSECGLILNNEYNVKLVILLTLLVFGIYLWWTSNKIDTKDSYYKLFLYLVCRYMPIIYVVVFPFISTTLLYRISFEMFIYLVTTIYLISFALGFGLLSLYSKEKVTQFVNKENKYVSREDKKYFKKR